MSTMLLLLILGNKVSPLANFIELCMKIAQQLKKFKWGYKDRQTNTHTNKTLYGID